MSDSGPAVPAAKDPIYAIHPGDAIEFTVPGLAKPIYLVFRPARKAELVAAGVHPDQVFLPHEITALAGFGAPHANPIVRVFGPGVRPVAILRSHPRG